MVQSRNTFRELTQIFGGLQAKENKKYMIYGMKEKTVTE